MLLVPAKCTTGTTHQRPCMAEAEVSNAAVVGAGLTLVHARAACPQTLPSDAALAQQGTTMSLVNAQLQQLAMPAGDISGLSGESAAHLWVGGVVLGGRLRT